VNSEEKSVEDKKKAMAENKRKKVKFTVKLKQRDQNKSTNMK
jgi:hypothetical protein